MTGYPWSVGDQLLADDLNAAIASASAGGGGAATRGVLNVLDFGADPTGVADSAPAFNAALATRPAGASVHLFVPAGTYRLDSTVVETDGRRVWAELDAGALVGASHGGVGAGVLYVGRVTQSNGNVAVTDTAGGLSTLSAGSQFVGDVVRVATDSNAAGYGIYSSYANNSSVATNVNGGDIAFNQLASWTNTSGVAGFIRWTQGVTPVTSAQNISGGVNWMLRAEEMNVVNNGPDAGYVEQVGSTLTGVGGYAIGPETWASTGHYGGHGINGFEVLAMGQANKRWPSYPAVFGSTTPTNLSGTDAFTVNGTAISGWTTGSMTEVAGKITAAAIANTSAAVDAFGRLVIYMTTANNTGALTLANSVGAPLAKIGLSSGTFTTPFGFTTVMGFANAASVGTSASISINGTTVSLNRGTGTVPDVVAAINGAGIVNTVAFTTYQNALVIVNQAKVALTIANVSGTPLTTLGINAGTYQPSQPPTAAAPYVSKLWNGVFINRNAIAPGGVGVYVGGDSSGLTANYPDYPVIIKGNWNHGIDTTLATFVDGRAQTMLAGQGPAWITGTTGTPTNICRDTAGTGSPEGVVTANKGSTYRRFDGAAGTCFYVKESGTGNTGWVAK